MEGYGQNLYIGGSDGVVEWWVCDGGAGSSHVSGPVLCCTNSNALRRVKDGHCDISTRSFRVGLSARSYSCPGFHERSYFRVSTPLHITHVAEPSDGTLHPLALPNLEVLPSTVIAPLRGVTSVVLDDEELGWDGGDEKGGEMTVVVVRRKGLGIYKLGSRMVPFKVSCNRFIFSGNH